MELTLTRINKAPGFTIGEWTITHAIDADGRPLVLWYSKEAPVKTDDPNQPAQDFALPVGRYRVRLGMPMVNDVMVYTPQIELPDGSVAQLRKDTCIGFPGSMLVGLMVENNEMVEPATAYDMRVLPFLLGNVMRGEVWVNIK